MPDHQQACDTIVEFTKKKKKTHFQWAKMNLEETMNPVDGAEIAANTAINLDGQSLFYGITYLKFAYNQWAFRCRTRLEKPWLPCSTLNIKYKKNV